MALRIKIADSAFHEQKVNLGGVLYTLITKYNNADKAWYLDLYDFDRNPLDTGIKVMPNQNLTGRYKYKTSLEDGNLWCFRTRNDYSPVGRDNFGYGKTYELLWLSSAEEIEGSINDTVQL